MVFGRRFCVQKIPSMVHLRQMWDGLIYVNTNSVIDCVYYRVAVLRVTQGGSFTCNTGGRFT